MRKSIVFLCFLMVTVNAYSQFIPEHISNTALYSFLDELATDGIITINTSVKPYSKSFIAEKLWEADRKKGSLSRRQMRELSFYSRVYRIERPVPDTMQWLEKAKIFRKWPDLSASFIPFGLVYKDSLFTFAARPIYGIIYRKNENGDVNHTFGGIEAYSTIAGHWGIYASLRDNHETELLADTGYFSLNQGGAYKRNNGGRIGGDYSEMRAGITYAWKWGDVGLLKDHFVWGDNYHGSNIFSGRTPSFAHIRLHLHPAKWIDFNYVHGWLVSEVVDSSRSYYNNNVYKQVFKQKFLAANLLTIIPIKKLYISLGNSIVYSDLGGIHAAYLIPFAFYKSIDHTLNNGIENQNSQMFFNISSRQIRHLHLFTSVFIDEFSVKRLKSKEAHNFISWKGGISLSNFPVKDLSVTAEFTQTTPITYKHDILAVTFESNQYNLGHYLGDNSREIYVAATYKPLKCLSAEFSYTFAEHGDEYAYIRNSEIANKPMLDHITWISTTYGLKTCYQFFDNCYLFFEYDLGKVEGGNVAGKTAQEYLDMFSPPFYQGNTNTVSFGFNLGF
jgi:hypothetical protein